MLVIYVTGNSSAFIEQISEEKACDEGLLAKGRAHVRVPVVICRAAGVRVRLYFLPATMPIQHQSTQPFDDGCTMATYRIHIRVYWVIHGLKECTFTIRFV